MFVDKRLLVHTVQVAKPTHTKDKTLYGEDEEPIWQVLNNVRFEEVISTQGTNNNKDRTRQAKLFVYPQFTPEASFNDDWLGGKVMFDNVVHKITNIKCFSYPFSDGIFSYEIEVI